MTNEQIIFEVTTQVLGVKKEEVEVLFRLMGGMSNYTYVIKAKGDKYTFRIPGKNAEKFVERQVETYHLDLIKPLGLSNETVYLDVKSGVKIAKYIEGNPLHELDPLDYLEEASAILHKLHDSKLVSKYNYDMLGRLSKYEGYLKEYKYTHTDRYLDLKAKFLELAKTYLNEDEMVLCHGDSQVSNFVVSGDEMHLMDWEFTGNNDPFYDVACFGNSNFEHAIALLPVYLGHEASQEDYNKLYFYRMFQTLQWHNVALYKEFIGLSVDLGVDFMYVASLYLDKAEDLFKRIK